MDRERILGGLTSAEKKMISEMVERFGWIAMLDCIVEDGREPAGDGFRTHRHSGRHDLVLILKRTDGREMLAQEIETEPASAKKKR